MKPFILLLSLSLTQALLTPSLNPVCLDLYAQCHFKKPRFCLTETKRLLEEHVGNSTQKAEEFLCFSYAFNYLS